MTGLARVIRGHMLTAYENVPLWHERDISHSSAERIILPDATIALNYMLNRFGNQPVRRIEKPVFSEEKQGQNVHYEPFKQQIMFEGILVEGER